MSRPVIFIHVNEHRLLLLLRTSVDRRAAVLLVLVLLCCCSAAAVACFRCSLLLRPPLLAFVASWAVGSRFFCQNADLQQSMFDFVRCPCLAFFVHFSLGA